MLILLHCEGPDYMLELELSPSVEVNKLCLPKLILIPGVSVAGGW